MGGSHGDFAKDSAIQGSIGVSKGAALGLDHIGVAGALQGDHPKIPGSGKAMSSVGILALHKICDATVMHSVQPLEI